MEFHKATKDVGKNEAVEVVRVEREKIWARKESGEEIPLTRRQAQTFSVQERRSLEVAPGDKLLLEANRREDGFRATNGELVTVARIDSGRIELEDGRTLPANYRQFDHGYVVTAHRSQGKTVDAVIVAGDRMSKELFYVAATRGRENLTIITSDKEQLREAIGISGERTSALELARQAEMSAAAPRLPELAIGHNLESAKSWALRHSVLQSEERGRVAQEKEHRKEQEIDYGYGFGL
jgi:hypothetical protein